MDNQVVEPDNHSIVTPGSETPPETNNILPPVITPQDNGPKKNKNTLFLVILLVVLLAGGAAGYYIWHTDSNQLNSKAAQSSKNQSKKVSNAVNTITAYLVFENDKSATSSTLTIVNPEGKVVKTINSTNAQSTFASSNSLENNANLSNSYGVLLGNQNQTGNTDTTTEYSVVNADSSVTQVGTPAVGIINNLSNNYDNSVFLSSNNTLLTNQLSADGKSSKFLTTNLTTGTQATLLTATSQKTFTTYFYMDNLNVQKNEVSFIADYVTLNQTTISSPSIVVYNLNSKTFKVYTLPSSVDGNFPATALEYGNGTGFTPDVWASADGNLAAYTINSTKQTGSNLYLYNTSSQKVIPSSQTNFMYTIGDELPMFSPDDKYVVTYQNTSGSGNNALLDVVSSADGSKVKEVNAGSTANINVQPAGWYGNDDLVYDTVTGSKGTFNPNDTTAYLLNISSGQTRNISGYGQLDAVLNFQK